MRWAFKFYTPKYIIIRKLRKMNKLKIGWGLRVLRFKEKLLAKNKESILKN